MFNSIMTSLCISLQGTLFERKPKKGSLKEHAENWHYSMNEREAPPYLLVTEEFKVRNDLITKLHARDGQISTTRESSKRGRAHWCPNHYQQHYFGETTSGADPRVAIYYHALGLVNAREARLV